MFKRQVVHADISIFFETIGNLMKGRYSGNPTLLRNEQRFLSYTDQDVLLVFYTCQSICTCTLVSMKRVQILQLEEVTRMQRESQAMS
jgi:hypothetical protein